LACVNQDFVVDCCVAWLLAAQGTALVLGAAFCLELQAQPFAPLVLGSLKNTCLLIVVFPKKILHKQLSSGHGLRSRRSVWHGASDPALCSLSVWLPPKIFFWWIVVLCFWPRLWDLALKIMKIGFGHRLYSPSFGSRTQPFAPSALSIG